MEKCKFIKKHIEKILKAEVLWVLFASYMFLFCPLFQILDSDGLKNQEYVIIYSVHSSCLNPNLYFL